MTSYRFLAFALAVLMLAAAANVAMAIDLTTYGQMTEQARVARYTNFIASHPSYTLNHTCGYDNNDSYGSGIGNVIEGFYDYTAEPGQNGWNDWYRMADGVIGNTSSEWIDTYQRTNSTAESVDEWIGYRFKRTSSVTSIVYSDCPTYDGGVFDAPPEVQVLYSPMEQGGTWTTVAATWDTTYSTDFAPDAESITTRTYTITPDSPTGQVWGVRLFGAPKLGSERDLSGWIAFSELQVSGDSSIAQTYNLTNNLAFGQTAIWSHDTQKDRPEVLTDGDVSNYETTYYSDETTDPLPGESWAGVLFSEAKTNVAACGVIQKMFKNGGWLDPETTVIEYTTDTDLLVLGDGSGMLDPTTPGTWTAVSNLDMGRWADVEAELGPLQAYWNEAEQKWEERRRIDQSELMTFDTIPVGITGIRIRGTTCDDWSVNFSSGDEDGFLGMTEFEVFAANAVSIPGDTNGDKVVNDADATTVASNWGLTGLTGGASVGDFNGDGAVDAKDASIMAAHWGDHNESEGTVPEPGFLALLASLALISLTRKARK